MADVIIVVIVVVLLSFAVKSSVKHFKGEGGCCGGGSASVKTRKPKKKKLTGPVTGHYTIMISGMHCQNCVNSVTNAINAIDGAAAKVSLNDQRAEVSCNREIEIEELIRAVEEAGFKVVQISDEG